MKTNIWQNSISKDLSVEYIYINYPSVYNNENRIDNHSIHAMHHLIPLEEHLAVWKTVIIRTITTRVRLTNSKFHYCKNMFQIIWH